MPGLGHEHPSACLEHATRLHEERRRARQLVHDRECQHEVDLPLEVVDAQGRALGLPDLDAGMTDVGGTGDFRTKSVQPDTSGMACASNVHTLWGTWVMGQARKRSISA